MYKNDPALFKGSAYYYSRFRRGYPKFFFEQLTKSFNLNNSSRVLDLGTGTGQIAIPFSKIVKEVVAVDPDKEMLDEGKKQAEEQNAVNINWIEAKAEELPDNTGNFELTTMGASFHWMKRDKVLEGVYSITKKNGGICIVSNTTSIYRNQKNDKWKSVARAVIEKYLGKKRRAGNSYFKEPTDRFEDIIARSKFSNLETFIKTYIQEWTIEQILGFLSSTSFAARRLFSDNIENFENDLREELLKLDRNGIFTEEVTLEALLAWKKN